MGRFQLRKFNNKEKDLPAVEYLDEIWLKTLLSCIGNDFKHSDKICGIRVVDGTSVSQNNNPLYRLELWFSSNDIKNSIKTEFIKLLNLPSDYEIFFKPHNSKN